MSKIYIDVKSKQVMDDFPPYYERKGNEPLYNMRYEYLEIPSESLVHVKEVTPIIVPHLSGVIFSRGRDLPPLFEETVRYWCGANKDIEESAMFYQNPLHEYMIDTDNETGKIIASEDRLVSEGYMVQIAGLGKLVLADDEESFVKLTVKVNEEFLRSDEIWLANEEGEEPPEGTDDLVFYLRVGDILASPNPDLILIDLIRFEMLDYGYYY